MSVLRRLFQPSIAKMRRSKDIAGLVEALRVSDTERRIKALAAVRCMGGAVPTAVVVNLLRDEDPRCRLAAAWTLMRLVGHEGAEHLHNACRSQRTARV